MLELIGVCIAAVFVIVTVLCRDSINMPLSWDDEEEDYIKCYNCSLYLRANAGHASSCLSCPFYPNEERGDEECRQ